MQKSDGTYTNSALHEALAHGVDDSDIRARSRAKLLAAGASPENLNLLFPDLPPLPT